MSLTEQPEAAMDVRVTLLGQPSVQRGTERVAPPKGKKVWALLAYLALTDRPVSRQRLAALLFDEADDPMAALRWNLAELRRLLGDTDLVRGDPIELRRDDSDLDLVLDVDVLVHGPWKDAIALDGLGLDLLEGMDFSVSAAFDAWLLTARRHFRALAGSMLEEAGLAMLADGQYTGAIDAAVRMVELDPFDENAQTLLVRSLAASGDRAAAQQQVRVCTELFRRELGIEPSPAVRLAAEIAPGSPTVAPIGGAAAARAQLEAGNAAIAAGAVEAGLQCLRRAVTEAEAIDDEDLHARALLSLGSALVHAVRGRDLEGAAALHSAIGIAQRTDARRIVATASRELGFVEVLAGHHERAEHWLARAEETAGNDDAERASINGIRGMALSDSARYPEAIAMLTTSIDLARRAGATRPEAWSLSILGRAHLLRGEHDEADKSLHESLELVRGDNWTAFLPWPEALAAEIDMLDGRVDRAAEAFDHAFALACQVGDPCWQGMAGRGAGLVELARADASQGIERLEDARLRCSQLPDSYQWVIAYVLDALCATAVRDRHPAANTWITQLERLAATTGLREFVARAYVHRAGLGERDAIEAARVLAEDIDNPRLHELVAVTR
jgi:DNA-binding SARP family transcriptional activator